MNKKCSSLLIEELPSLVYFLRQNFCSAEISKLTMQQHRLMSLLLKNQMGASALAHELGISLPAVSRMIQPLIEEGWILKLVNQEDKRNCILKLTPLGSKTLLESKKNSQGQLSQKIANLKDSEKKIIIEAFDIFRKLKSFSEENV